MPIDIESREIEVISDGEKSSSSAKAIARLIHPNYLGCGIICDDPFGVARSDRAYPHNRTN
ncbi:MAG: hypothetical protein F6K41_36700 [Symploca sp. SIO3E6]|nr:hypothetical protein [Caldora sp. SIO3E6]